MKKIIQLLAISMCIGNLSASEPLLLSTSPHLKERSCTMPLSGWPLTFFDNVYPGASYRYRSSSEHFLSTCEKAYSATKAQADTKGWPKKYRHLYDWFYTLSETERLYLAKPFETWTIADLAYLAQCLTRLTSAQPGSFRTKQRSYKKPRPEESRHAAEAQTSVMSEDMLIAPDPRLIEEYFNQALLQTKAVVNDALSLLDPVKQKIGIIKSAAHLFYEIYRIQPFGKAVKSMGRLASALVLGSHGIKPVIFPSKSYLDKVLYKCVQTNSSDPLQLYMLQMINIKKQQKQLASFDAEIEALHATQSSDSEAETVPAAATHAIFAGRRSGVVILKSVSQAQLHRNQQGE